MWWGRGWRIHALVRRGPICSHCSASLASLSLSLSCQARARAYHTNTYTVVLSPPDQIFLPGLARRLRLASRLPRRVIWYGVVPARRRHWRTRPYRAVICDPPARNGLSASLVTNRGAVVPCLAIRDPIGSSTPLWTHFSTIAHPRTVNCCEASCVAKCPTRANEALPAIAPPPEWTGIRVGSVLFAAPCGIRQ